MLGDWVETPVWTGSSEANFRVADGLELIKLSLYQLELRGKMAPLRKAPFRSGGFAQWADVQAQDSGSVIRARLLGRSETNLHRR